MGRSAVLVRLVAVCAVTAVAGGVLASTPVSAQTPAAASAASPNTPVVSPALVRRDALTPRAAKKTGLKITVVGVSAGGRASVTVTGPKQSKAKKAKKYSKVIHRSKTLKVRPGKYKVRARTVAATGGTDVPAVATKKLRVRKNKLTGFTVSYTFVATTPAPPPPPAARLTQTITFPTLANTAFNATAPILDADASSDLAVTYTSATGTVCTVTSAGLITFESAGLCTIVANQAGNANYAAATPVSQSFNVTQGAQTVTFTSSAPSATVGGPTYTPAAFASSGLAVALAVDAGSSAVCSMNGSGAVSFQTVGECVINANQAGNANYSAATQVQQTVTVGALLCADDGTCVVGDTGPGGGKVFYVASSTQPWGTYLEAAPADWNGGSPDPSVAWCDVPSTLLGGTFGTAIGSGKDNTDLMVAGGACTSGAANSVRAYGGGNVSWSLPSKDELNALYTNQASVGGFADDYYWSSSQLDALNAWYQNFVGDDQGVDGGDQVYDSKGLYWRVRPVRAF